MGATSRGSAELLTAVRETTTGCRGQTNQARTEQHHGAGLRNRDWRCALSAGNEKSGPGKFAVLTTRTTKMPGVAL